jgi:hypothetical protein
MPRHDDPDPRFETKGSDVSDLEVRGPESLPFMTNQLKICLPCQPCGRRKALQCDEGGVRRQRTLTAASR